jgi:hypothetical protein
MEVSGQLHAPAAVTPGEATNSLFSFDTKRTAYKTEILGGIHRQQGDAISLLLFFFSKYGK